MKKIKVIRDGSSSSASSRLSVLSSQRAGALAKSSNLPGSSAQQALRNQNVQMIQKQMQQNINKIRKFRERLENGETQEIVTSSGRVLSPKSKAMERQTIESSGQEGFIIVSLI